jgi:hypothetical protein
MRSISGLRFHSARRCSVLPGAFRLRRGQGDELDVETAWPLTSVIVSMSYDNDQQVPRYLAPTPFG